jgi:hypothetical protein
MTDGKSTYALSITIANPRHEMTANVGQNHNLDQEIFLNQRKEEKSAKSKSE